MLAADVNLQLTPAATVFFLVFKTENENQRHSIN